MKVLIEHSPTAITAKPNINKKLTGYNSFKFIYLLADIYKW